MNKRILIADDDPTMIFILHHLLTEQGFEVITVNNGNDALETAINIKPDLLILDLMMPGLDGIGVIMKLYGNSNDFDSPAILLTAQDPAQYKELAESFGSIRFVSKPFDTNSFKTMIRDLLKV